MIWNDTMIQTGDMWRDEIEAALARTKVGVLLVSPDFFKSNFIADNELPPLLEAARVQGAQIFWIPVRPSMYTETPLATFQAAHDPDRPLSGLSTHGCEQALVKIGSKLKKAMEA